MGQPVANNHEMRYKLKDDCFSFCIWLAEKTTLIPSDLLAGAFHSTKTSRLNLRKFLMKNGTACSVLIHRNEKFCQVSERRDKLARYNLSFEIFCPEISIAFDFSVNIITQTSSYQEKLIRFNNGWCMTWCTSDNHQIKHITIFFRDFWPFLVNGLHFKIQQDISYMLPSRLGIVEILYWMKSAPGVNLWLFLNHLQSHCAPNLPTNVEQVRSYYRSAQCFTQSLNVFISSV